MELPPLSTPIESKKETLEAIKIQQDKNNYILNIEIEGDLMTFKTSIKENIGTTIYNLKLSLQEIKQLHKALNLLNTCKDFYDYLKLLSDNKQLVIKINDNKLSINFYVEFLLKKELIELNLFPEKADLNVIVKDICNELTVIKDKLKNLEENKNKKEKEQKVLEEKIINLEKENILLKKNCDIQNNEIKILKEEIEYIKKYYNKKKKIKSVIIEDNELDFIESAIKSRINKNIKEIKKIYQATIDGAEPTDFHSKCDNISNTLTIVKSIGNKRFGGFTSNSWDSISEYKDDQNAFIFSIDKQKIYPCKNHKYAIYCNIKEGPIFGSGFDIWIEGNILKNNRLTCYKSSYEHNCDFLEVTYPKYTKALDYEVFQIIFD